MTASLYIHVPFCSSLCDYCDFYSVPIHTDHDSDFMDSYIIAVLNDVKEQLDRFNVTYVPTVYIGGGTPSMLGAARIRRLLDGLQALLKPMEKPFYEFTVEANPESADEDFLKACVYGGVNRLSLGVQTFHEASRHAVHRAADVKLLDERLALAAGYFPNSLSIDLITGLPLQTADIILNDIERILAYKPVHISLYSLCLEPETVLGKQVRNYGAAALSLPHEDESDNLWIRGRDRLETAGYTQYEVSNFALHSEHPQPNQCAHNIRYWRMENWLGAGPAASGTIINNETGSGRRYTYQPDISAYLTGQQPCTEELDRAALIRESLLMGYRYQEGPDLLLFKQRFACEVKNIIPRTIKRWRNRGFFAGEKVSRQGILFLNSFLRDAFTELDSASDNYR